MDASKTEIGRQGQGPSLDAERCKGESDHASQSSPAAESPQCGRARLETDRASGPGQDSQTGNGRVLVCKEPRCFWCGVKKSQHHLLGEHAHKFTVQSDIPETPDPEW